MILLELFFCFFQIGLFSIGGGYAAISLIQNQTVNLHAWITFEEFMDLATIAEMTPGPIAINGATFVGLKIAGLPGAVVSILGCILPSLVIVSLLSYIYSHYRQLPMLKSILSTLNPAIVALIAAAAANMILQIALGAGRSVSMGPVNWTGLLLFGCAFLLLRKSRFNPIAILLLCGAINLLVGSLMV